MTDFHLAKDLLKDPVKEPIRAGFGRGLKKAGEVDNRVVALCADLTESVQMHLFRDAFPERTMNNKRRLFSCFRDLIGKAQAMKLRERRTQPGQPPSDRHFLFYSRPLSVDPTSHP